jgi:ADP-heptose:LPS heptosyltransferase
MSLHPGRIQRSVIPRIFHSGSQFFVIQIAGLVVFNSDNLIISHYLGPAQVTPYSLIWRIVGYAILIQNMVNPALWPAYSEAYARGDLAWIRSAYGKLRKGTLVSLTIGCLVLIPFGQGIIRVWAGRSAVPSQTLIVLMCVWMILIAITRNQGTLLGATSRMRGQAIAAGIASAVNLALSIAWVRPFGTIGVLLATIATYLVFVCTVQTWGIWSIFHRSQEGARLYVAGVGFNWRKSVIRRCRRSMRYCFWGVLQVIAFLRPENQRQTARPRRILLVNGAHLGDVVISTGLLPVLRSAFPDAEIGFATASWAHDVIETHPDITYTHTIDQWKLNRSNVGFWKKWIQYRGSRACLLRELRERQYDWAICLHLWSPDCLDLAWLAGIPVRAAFAHSHMAPLATHRVRYPHEMSFMTAGACQAELLRALGVQQSHLRLRKASIPVTQDGLEELKSILPCPDIIPAGYCVVHMGAGAPVRELPSSFWRTLVQFESQSSMVVLTGKGKRDAEQIARVTKGMMNCVSVCDTLSWKGFVSAIRHARKVYSVDTVAMHVAAAVGTPCSAVCTGISGVGRWRPEGEQVTIWANHVPCAPCERRNGCPEMSCLKGIHPADLLNASRQDSGADPPELPIGALN